MSSNGKFIILQFFTSLPQSTALNIQSSIFYISTSNLFYLTSIIDHQLFFLHPYSKPQTGNITVKVTSVLEIFVPEIFVLEIFVNAPFALLTIALQYLSSCFPDVDFTLKVSLLTGDNCQDNICPGNKSSGDNCNPLGISLYSSFN